MPWWSGGPNMPLLAAPAWCPVALTSPLLSTAACPQMSTPNWCTSAAMSTTSATAASWRTCSRGQRGGGVSAVHEWILNRRTPSGQWWVGSGRVGAAEGLNPCLFCWWPSWWEARGHVGLYEAQSDDSTEADLSQSSGISWLGGTRKWEFTPQGSHGFRAPAHFTCQEYWAPGWTGLPSGPCYPRAS